jgi:hypothetical protein
MTADHKIMMQSDFKGLTCVGGTFALSVSGPLSSKTLDTVQNTDSE